MQPPMGSTAFDWVSPGPDAAAAVTDVLCDAFRSYPVMRYVLAEPPDTVAAAERLRKLIGFFVLVRVIRSEPMVALARGSELNGVAVMSYPEQPTPPGRVEPLREAVWSELGADARARYEAFGAATAPFFGDTPRVHLNMIGVRSAVRGSGLARRLLDRVHAFARGRAGSTGVSLTTEDPANVQLYEHFGYRVVGHARVDDGLETWGLLRPHD